MSWLKNKYVWFFFLPVAVALLVFGPYWGWSLWTGQGFGWRIPIISGTVFDTYAYLQWLGQTSHGWEIGGHVRWYIWPLRALTRLLPNASIAEWWLISRWISMVAVLWIGGWAVRRWSGLDVARSRLVSLALWLSFVMALGMRPGVYSWYLPFGILALTLPLDVQDGLARKKYVRALLLTGVTLAASFVYSWFFIVAVVWLAALWAEWLISRSRKLFLMLLGAGILATLLITPTLAAYLSQSPEGTLLLDLQIKSGLGFTRFPQLTNSFFALLAWVVFLSVAARSWTSAPALSGAWLAVLFSWLITPFTGIYLHNDHFRTPVVILSWITLALAWASTDEEGSRPSRSARWIAGAVFAASLVFILNILRQPYAFNNDDLNILHFSHWFALAFVLGVWIMRRKIKWQLPVLLGAVLIGGVGTLSILFREWKELPQRVSRLPEINWIKYNVPLDKGVCSDPTQADFLATFTGLRIFPAGTTLYYREPTLEGLRRMRVFSSAYDVEGSGSFEYVKYINHFGRSMICQQFPRQVQFLRRLGFSEARINEWAGCPQELIRQLDEYTLKTTRQAEVDASAFKEICPWVIISAEQKRYWRLPEGYQETAVTPSISVWNLVGRQ